MESKYDTYYETYGAMTTEELEKKSETFAELRRSAATEYLKELKTIINGYAEECGIKGVDIKCWHNDIYNLEIGKWGEKETWSDSWDFDFRIDRWHKDDGKYNPHCSLNIGVSCCFIHTDWRQIEKFSLFGVICKNLKTIEDKLLNLESFKFFNEFEDQLSVIHNIIQNRNVEKEREEREAKRVYFTSKIAVGTVIDMRPDDNPKDTDTGCWANKLRRLKKQKIEWKTEKNVRFADDYNRTKMSSLVDNLISGKWKIVEYKEGL